MDKPKRKPRKPCEEEQIYTSETGASIRTSQLINEMLCRFRAEFLGIDGGEKPWEHPELQGFYMNQWSDISNAIKQYGDRVVLDAVSKNKWICNPRYKLPYPLRSIKLREQMSTKASKACTPAEQKPLPRNHVPETKKKVRDF